MIAATAAAVLATLVGLLAVRWHNPQFLFGDEPHYLVISRSLILDSDVDVKNDYVEGRYLRYFPAKIEPHVNTTIFTADDPHWFPIHGVGLPALLVPAVWASDADGAAIAMVGIAVIVLVLTFFWVRRFTGNVWLSALAAGTLGISPFFLGLQSRIFPDLPTAALLLGCLLILEMSERRRGHLLLLGVLVGVSPWFHFKNALPFAAIGVIAFVQVVRGTDGTERIRRALLLAGPALASAVGYELAVHAWYGSWLPTRMFPPGNEAFALAPTTGMAAASFDSARGLLSINPALMLIPAGLPLWARKWPAPFLRLALVLVPTIWIQATFNDWAGGFNAPAGRYALQFTPAFVPAIALLLREAPRAFRALASPLVGFHWVLGAAFVWLKPDWGVSGEPSPFLREIERRLGPALDRWMPTFDVRGVLTRGRGLLLAWVAAAGLLLLYGSRCGASRAGSPREDAPADSRPRSRRLTG